MQDFKEKVSSTIDHNIPNSLWQTAKEAIQNAANNTIPAKEPTRPGKGWMTDEILNLVDERRAVKGRNDVQYYELTCEIKRKCNEAKEIWLNGECEEVEASILRNSNELYDKVKKLSGKKGNSRSGCIRSEDGVMLTESQDICNRWVRYIKELFDETRNDPPTIEAEIEGLEISRDEIRSGMKKMGKGKAVGPDEVSVEMLEALDEKGIDLLYRISTTPANYLTIFFVNIYHLAEEAQGDRVQTPPYHQPNESLRKASSHYHH